MNIYSKFQCTLFLTLFSYVIPCHSQSKPAAVKKINFIEQSWTLALKKAQTEHKYIFVDAYATWCGPCKQLKAVTFKNGKAADFFNEQFVNLSIDTEKGQGAELAAKWGLESYPTLYIFDSKGVLIQQSEGFLNAQELLSFGQKALKK